MPSALLCCSLLVALGLYVSRGFHSVDDGHIGVYKQHQRLLVPITSPGMHWHIPFVQTVHFVEVRQQTDRLSDVVCGSSKGGVATLDIEVVNQLTGTEECVNAVVSAFTLTYDQPLIYDNIPSEVAQFCKNYPLEDIYIRRFDELDERLTEKLNDVLRTNNVSDCLTIHNIRIGRPQLSEEMTASFAAIEREEKARDLEQMRKQTAKVKLETELQAAKAKSQQAQEEARIEQETLLLVATKTAQIRNIENNATRQYAETAADVKRMEAQSEADGIAMKIVAFGNDTYAMLDHEKTQMFAKTLGNTSVLYFGEGPEWMPKYTTGHGGSYVDAPPTPRTTAPQ